MDNRARIPALALLGLSFTDCDRGEQPASTIVGDWRAVDIDGRALPEVESGGGATARNGFQLQIDEDDGGLLAYYTDYEYGPQNHHSEYGGDVTVDDADAPTYRLTVVDFIGVSYDGGYYAIPDPGGALLREQLARPIAAPHEPAAALPTFTLACTLDGDSLTCDREGAVDGEDLRKWVFARQEPDAS